MRSTKYIYLFLVMLILTLFLYDHLTSPVMTSVSSPSKIGKSCAPCGAPCLSE
ncbi:MAG: hypothetical protein HOE17_08020 [Rhodobiaceae bacterium]|nr:hypothetical protein [Rhodobiaceae bacterium]